MLSCAKTRNLLTPIVLILVMFYFTTAGSENNIEARLQVLEDREEIRALLNEYGRTLDVRDFRSFSELFAKDVGEWNGGMGIARGPEAIRKLMEETIGNNTGGINSPNFHIFNNEVIEVNGERATALSKWTFVIQGDDGRPQWVYLGHYNDVLIREDGRWKFLQRKVTGDIPGEER